MATYPILGHHPALPEQLLQLPKLSPSLNSFPASLSSIHTFQPEFFWSAKLSMSWPSLNYSQWLPTAFKVVVTFYGSCKVQFLLLSPASFSSLRLLHEQLINLSNCFQFQECAMSTFMTLHMLFLLAWITFPLSLPGHFPVIPWISF